MRIQIERNDGWSKDRNVYCDDLLIGHLDKSEFGRGYYLSLQGILWINTPGARFVADAGSFPKTYVKSLTEARGRTYEALETKGWKDGKRPPDYK
jgi:hypothetical protein